MSKYRKYEYSKKKSNDEFKRIKDPSNKRRDKKKITHYDERDYSEENQNF